MIDMFPLQSSDQVTYKFLKEVASNKTSSFEAFCFPSSQANFELKMFLLLENLDNSMFYYLDGYALKHFTKSVLKKKELDEPYSVFLNVINSISDVHMSEKFLSQFDTIKSSSIYSIIDYIAYIQKRNSLEDYEMKHVYSGYTGTLQFYAQDDTPETNELFYTDYIRISSPSEYDHFRRYIVPKLECDMCMLFTDPHRSNIFYLHMLDDQNAIDNDGYPDFNTFVGFALTEVYPDDICSHGEYPVQTIDISHVYGYKDRGRIITTSSNGLKLYYSDIYSNGDIYISE